jgi:hypothetical protein
MGMAGSLFQPRAFGISGADAANIALANITGQNNYNQFLYSTKVQGAQYNQQIQSSNAIAGAQAQGNMVSGGITAGVSIATAFAMSCWVAAEIFGRGTPEFGRFRFWLLNLAPKGLRRFYLQRGRAIAKFVKDKCLLKALLCLPMRLAILGVPLLPGKFYVNA